MSFDEINLEPSKLLASVNEHLNLCFFACPRAEAKQLYQLLVDGGSEPFLHIQAGSKGEVVLELQLDHSEHIGKLSFSQFRKALAMMMLAIKHRVDENLNLNPLYSETGQILFNVPGVLESGETTNVMVCGLDQLGAGRAALRLMYLNPTQYIQAAAEVSDPPAAS